MKLLVAIAAVFLCYFPAQAADAAGDVLIQAILKNDIAGLKARLAAGANPNAKGERDTTPLMYAAAYGSLNAMEALIDAKADVNARNAFEETALLWSASDLEKVRLLLSKGANANAASTQGRTALLIAAAHDGSEEIVRLLIKSGADPKLKDGRQTTALLLAALADNLPVLKLMLERGVDVNARNLGRGLTPLMAAAGLNNLEAIRLLLAKGADVNLFTPPDMDGTVKNGPIALGHISALMFAAPHGTPAVVKTLLAAGADPKATDIRGMTPLMYSVASEHQNPEVVRLLLGAGADPAVKSLAGETAKDWAGKFGRVDTLRLFAEHESGLAAAPRAVANTAAGGTDARKAVERSIALLQTSSASFFRNGGCVACHHSDMAAFATGVAVDHGIQIDETAAAEQLKQVKAQWSRLQDRLLQRFDVPGGPEEMAFALFGLASNKYPFDTMTAAMSVNLAGMQNRDGSWRQVSFARTPMQDSDLNRTALSLRGLQAYIPPGRQAEFERRIRSAGEWLLRATPVDTEERAMQLLGLKWAAADAGAIRKVAKVLLAEQKSDGGWSQNPNLPSDAYATALALYALNGGAGLAVSDAAYQRGVNYLLSTQAADGSWHVKSRAVKLQPYFQSGFPYEHDQWISNTATAWAAAALALAADPMAHKAQARLR